MVIREKAQLISTGNPEMDQRLDGGIPAGSLVLLEGEADSGKSVLAQHFTYQALASGLSVAYYTTETTIKDLISQMVSLGLDVTDYFLCDRLRVYPLRFSAGADTAATFQRLLEHFKSLPGNSRLVVVDALSGLISQSEERQIIDFFAACQGLGDLGRTIILVVHSDAGEDALLGRIRSICDTHLALRIEQQDGRPARTLEVTKVGGGERPAGDLTAFSIEPGAGIKTASQPNSRR